MVQSKMRVIMMKSAEMKKSEPEKQTIQLTPEQEVVIGRLYDENYNDLFRYAAVLLSASDAEEAVQNLFVDACKPKQLKKLMEYEKNGQFKEQKAWLGKGIKFSISKIRRSKGQFAKSIEYLPPDADEEFGAEIGISTQKLHARGPMGLKELTTTKYVIYGNGQIR